jgi:phage terminase small subunit
MASQRKQHFEFVKRDPMDVPARSSEDQKERRKELKTLEKDLSALTKEYGDREEDLRHRLQKIPLEPAYDRMNAEGQREISGFHDDTGRFWPLLTEREEAFCDFYITERMTIVQAAIQAGMEGPSRGAIYLKLREKILSNPVMHNRLVELRDEEIHRANTTLEGHLIELARLREKAVDNGQFSAAITAEVARGKAAGLYVDKREITLNKVDSMSKEEIVARLVEMQESRIIDITPESAERDTRKSLPLSP